jgi:membrane protease YdiL (CAAX protease family)
LHSNTNHPISLWSVRITIPILSFYLLLVLPGKNILFHTNPWGINHTDTIYYLIITSFAVYRLNLKLLGFSTKNLKSNLTVGLLSGGGILVSLVLLNFGVDMVGSAGGHLFVEDPNSRNSININSMVEFLGIILIVPIIEQVFFTSIIYQSLAKEINHILAIYSSGIIYSLAKYKLNLGTFFLGVLTSLLFKETKTLYAPIIFHASCATGGIIVKNFYPRLKTILGFLF